jgi:1A family penicillin-binding protein
MCMTANRCADASPVETMWETPEGVPDTRAEAVPRALSIIPLRQKRLRQICYVVAVVVAAIDVTTVLLMAQLPDTSAIRALGDQTHVTTLFDAYDRPIFSLYKEERIDIPLSEVSPHLVHAVVAVEDQHFYQHHGIDVVRIGAAGLIDLWRRDRAQGGSTITQQLARQAFLDDRKTLWRKTRELGLAIAIEHEFTKDKILELYLNKVYFGHGYYGVEAAARGYFGKTARKVTVDEAAMLAGLIQAPSAYAPQAHPERAHARRRTVLMRMVEAGYLDRASAERLGRAPIHLTESPGAETFGRYFRNFVTRQLVQQFGEERVFDGGMRVYTTIDAAIQRAADAAIAEGVARVEQEPAYKRARLAAGKRGATPSSDAMASLQGALVALDPKTGEIRALVGGRDYDESTFDRATQARRQPGSAFKPFIYAAALESGFTPATLVTDLDSETQTGEHWTPNEAHGSDASAMTVRAALRTSSNRAAVEVLRDVGIPRAISYIKMLGFESPPAVPSLALGTGEVTVLSMTAAYSAFANGGRVPSPLAIRRVEDAAGRVIFTGKSTTSRAIKEDTAFLMAQMLSDVINAGTGYKARREGFTLPAAGKTGTTDDVRDVWFAGFTPSLAATVWLGFDRPQTIATNGFAGDLAAPIWGRFMRAATGNRDGTWLRQPSNVIAVRVCRLSGQLPVDGCDHVEVSGPDGTAIEKSFVGTEYFRRGTEPTDYCTLH